MSQKSKIRDITSAQAVKFTVSESNEQVNGQSVLAKVKGVFFVPEGVSRNNRYYSRSLWEKALSRPEVMEKMKRKLMFGTIGHDLEIDDKALREGLVSHIVTDAKIDEAGQGIGEALVLNTPVGQILNNLLRAGCQMYVSSRANGTYSGDKDGIPAVDEDAYDLSGWDFVLEAGFLQANPQLAESLNKLNLLKTNETILKNKENSFMETAKLNEDLVKATLDENKDLKLENKRLNEEVEQLKADVDQKDKENKDLADQADELKPKLEKLAKYEELGSPEEIKADQEAAEKNEQELAQFKELGDSPEEVEEALLIARKTLTSFQESFGTKEQVKEALEKAIEFKKQVESLGGLKKIKEALTIAAKVQEEAEAAEKDKEASDLAAELEMPKEEVQEMLKTASKDQIKAVYGKVAESFKKSSFVKKPVKLAEGQNIETGEGTSINESVVSGERFSRINAAFVR